MTELTLVEKTNKAVTYLEDAVVCNKLEELHHKEADDGGVLCLHRPSLQQCFNSTSQLSVYMYAPTITSRFH